jgi:organic hydroperoxide reductase OsmC/OhrA
MEISARVSNRKGRHSVQVRTGDREQSLEVPSKPDGFGSNVNGGELLLLALATCYCNDVYREAKKRSIEISEVEVHVGASFGAEGEPARDIHYRAIVTSTAPQADVRELMHATDTLAEIHNTLRAGVAVELREAAVRASVPDES